MGIVRIDWDGDGSRVGVFRVDRGAAVPSTPTRCGHVEYRVECTVCGHVETLHYHPAFAEQPDVEECAAVDGSCDEPCEGVA